MARDDRDGAVRHTEVAPADGTEEQRRPVGSPRPFGGERHGSYWTARDTATPVRQRRPSRNVGLLVDPDHDEGSVPRPGADGGRRIAAHDLEDAVCTRVAVQGEERGAKHPVLGECAALVVVVGSHDLEETYGCLSPHGLLDGHGRNGSGRAVIDEHSDHLCRLPRRIAEPMGVTKGRRHAITIRRPDPPPSGSKVPSRRPAWSAGGPRLRSSSWEQRTRRPPSRRHGQVPSRSTWTTWSTS